MRSQRYWVYRAADRRNYLCVCKATSEEHALEIAGRMFHLERSAYAVLERRG